MAEPRIAVVGAGLAGLAAARALADAGQAAQLFEKSRGLGGRLSWRRTDVASFDHGAQFVTARTDAFAAYLAGAERAGAAARWPAAEAARADGRAAFVGTPGMSRLAQPLAAGLQIATGVRVAAMTREGAEWVLTAKDGAALGRFDAVLLAIPAPQAETLLGPHPFAARVAEAVYAPCWAGLFAFGERLDLPDVVRDSDGPLAWVARDGSKPGRDEAESFVVHAGPEWSRANLERTAEDVARDLLAALRARAAAPAVVPTYAAAHRWRFAQVERALGEACLFDPETRLGVAGDFCLGARAEAAFESGRAAAVALLQPFSAA